MTEAVLRANVESGIEVHTQMIRACPPALMPVADALVGAHRAGRKALFFGNSGSAAEALHLAASLLAAHRCDVSPGQPRVFDIWSFYIYSSETPCRNGVLARTGLKTSFRLENAV